MTRRQARLATALLALAGLAGAQTNPAARAARAWRESHERAILGEFLGLLALPNLARDTEAIRQNAAAVSALFEKRGVKTRPLEVPGAPPAVYGEIVTPSAARTIVFYVHYDGQPLDPKEWATPPWEPVVRDRATEKDAKDLFVPAS
jgi:acetylornithine deacetylase/succinyl-diaminopimelate desuccinylase-like protein